MKIEGSFQVAASPERVWDSIWEADAVAAWVPGCLHARWEGRERVRGEVEQSVAQLKARFAFDLEVTAIQPPRHLSLQGGGEGISIASQVNMTLDIDLEAVGDLPDETPETRVRYAMNAEITGKLALAGNLVLKLKAKQLQKEMAQGVKALLESS